MIRRKEKTEGHSVGIIGLGRVGSVLARICMKREIEVNAVFDENQEAIGHLFSQLNCRLPVGRDAFKRSRIVIISVPDAQIEPAAWKYLSGEWFERNTLLVHTSAVHQWGDELAARYEFIAFGAMHPLMAFPSNPANVESFSGVGFGLSGSDSVIRALESLASRLGASPFLFPCDHRLPYHTSAVFASNFPVLLQHIALELMMSTGLPDQKVREILTGLLKSVLDNLTRESPRDALSGPAVRGDDATIEAHLNFLENKFPRYASIYRSLTDAIIELIHGESRRN